MMKLKANIELKYKETHINRHIIENIENHYYYNY